MKLYISITPQLLLGTYCLLSGIHVNAVTTAKCNADNCLRAMFPTNNPAQLSTASAFCATFTSRINTASTGFPTRAAAACGSCPKRFSSVCLCQPKFKTTTSTSSVTRPTSTTRTSTSSTSTTPATTIPTTTTPTSTPPTSTSPTSTIPTTTDPTSTTLTTTATTSATTPPCEGTGIVKNGGFECGIAPWQPAATPGTVYAITSPGYSGQFAFEVDQVTTADTSSGAEQASVNQDVTLEVGVNYILFFESYFNRGDAGFIGVKIDQAPIYTVDAEDKNGPLVWNSNSVPFTATNTITNIRFEFLFGAAGSVDKIDDISIALA